MLTCKFCRRSHNLWRTTPAGYKYSRSLCCLWYWSSFSAYQQGKQCTCWGTGRPNISYLQNYRRLHENYLDQDYSERLFSQLHFLYIIQGFKWDLAEPVLTLWCRETFYVNQLLLLAGILSSRCWNLTVLAQIMCRVHNMLVLHPNGESWNNNNMPELIRGTKLPSAVAELKRKGRHGNCFCSFSDTVFLLPMLPFLINTFALFPARHLQLSIGSR